MTEKKNKKISKKEWIIIAIISFFIIYIIVFSFFKNKIGNSSDNSANIILTNNIDGSGDNTLAQKELTEQEQINKNKKLIVRFKEARKIYIGDNKVSHIRVDGASLENFYRSMSNFIKIRNVDNDFIPTYSGKSSNGINFTTDFNYFELFDGKRKEYFKIPISEKVDFQKTYRKLIYTSVEFITNGDKVGSIKVYHDNDIKNIWFWKKKELLNKILYKREVGKIQPEKEFQKTKNNYTIKLDKSGVKISIQTMGPDFIKVSCGDNTAYYEVYPDLYSYLNDMFK